VEDMALHQMCLLIFGISEFSGYIMMQLNQILLLSHVGVSNGGPFDLKIQLHWNNTKDVKISPSSQALSKALWISVGNIPFHYHILQPRLHTNIQAFEEAQQADLPVDSAQSQPKRGLRVHVHVDPRWGEWQESAP
jgi:hypothetical protein